MRGFLRLLRDPVGFYSGLAGGPARLKGPLLVVAPLAAVAAVGQFLVAAKVAGALLGGWGGIALASVLSASAFLGVFASWLVLSLAMYLLSTALGGRCGFRRVFQFVGYGYLPLTLASLALAPLVLHRLLSVEPQGAPASVAAALAPRHLVWATSTVELVADGWSALLWTAALRAACSLAPWRALAAVLAPVAPLAALRLYYVVWPP